jgi:outer membrane translocation and assembly module TamA
MGRHGWILAAAGLALSSAPVATAQPVSAPEHTRAGQIEAQQADKARAVAPYRPGPIEGLVRKIDEHLTARHVRWHPFYGPASHGAGVTAGAGYMFHTGDYDGLDVRAALSLNGSKRAEAEFRRPNLFRRRAALTVLGGWREGFGQNFFGLGTAAGSRDDRTEFDFRQTYGSATLDARPRRRLVLAGGLEYLRYEQRGGSITARYSADTLAGVGQRVDYFQPHGRIALDWRPAADYARRGGAYGVTARRYIDAGGPFSFTQVDYDLVQHLPVLRDAWVISLRARAETTFTGAGDAVPFFMMPFLGNATTLRGFRSTRFRDRQSLLLSAEWRILLNASLDAAVFYDAGKVTGRRAELNLRGLKSDYGVGLRFHTPASTPLRFDLAHSNEGFRMVVGATAAF